MSGFRALEILLAETTEQHRIVKNALRKAPKGALKIQKNGEYDSFLRVTYGEGGRIRKGIGKDEELVYKLANKAYLEELERGLSRNIEVLERCVEKSVSVENENILSAMPKHFDCLDSSRLISLRREGTKAYQNPVRDKSIMPVGALLMLGDMDPEKWACMPYAENTKCLEFKTNYSSSGLACRSKSEAALLDLYDHMGILFHYDEVIEINGRYLSPDIIGLREDGVFIYHEHVGFQDADYRNNLQWKLDVYASKGIILGKNLILTFDDEYGRINLKLAAEIIEDRYKINKIIRA